MLSWPGVVKNAWYVACASGELEGEPIARAVLGQPLVLFRDGEGKAGALLDRCAHRNVALSLGRRTEGRLQCAYHGWQYDVAGQCRKIPGRCVDAEKTLPRVPAFAVREQDGFVWVFAAPDASPAEEPFRLPEAQGYSVVRRTVDVEGALQAALENALDVPHTAILHRGLFRGSGGPHRIKVVVTRTDRSVQAEYVGEPRPSGLAGKILSPSGGTVTHFDRFILPSIAQVDYRIGEGIHLLNTAIFTPLEEGRVRIHAVVQFKASIPHWLIKLFLTPVGERIFEQDTRILRAQAQAAKRFGGEHYTSTELDVLGAQIARLLRRAERGAEADADLEPDGGWRREIEMDV